MEKRKAKEGKEHENQVNRSEMKRSENIIQREGRNKEK